jgi:hypothetical protein
VIISRRIRWAGQVVSMGEIINSCKPKGKRHLKDLYLDNIKMDLREMKRGVAHSVHLIQDRDQWLFVNTIMNIFLT